MRYPPPRSCETQRLEKTRSLAHRSERRNERSRLRTGHLGASGYDGLHEELPNGPSARRDEELRQHCARGRPSGERRLARWSPARCPRKPHRILLAPSEVQPDQSSALGSLASPRERHRPLQHRLRRKLLPEPPEVTGRVSLASEAVRALHGRPIDAVTLGPVNSASRFLCV